MTVSNEPSRPDAQLNAMLDRASFLDAEYQTDTFEELDARLDRMYAVSSFADLDPGDQEWLNRACVLVTSGGSSRMRQPEALADFAGEDAALEAGGPVPVHLVPPGETDDAPLTEEESAELAMYDDDVDVLDVEDEGWVGL